MKIAIPSHRRRQVIETQTLPMLRDCGVKMDTVYVFVSDEQDFKTYDSLKEAWGIQLIFTRELPDIVEKFNFIHSYFGIGEEVVFVEDDIQSLAFKAGENKLEKFTKLEDLARGMFDFCKESKTKLWGISSNANPFYMKDKKTFGLKFVVANLFGFISTQDQFLKVSQICKSDYERTLLYFVKYGGICRMDGVCAVTKNYKTAGGLQELKSQRDLLEIRACKYLVKRFPHLIEINEKKSSTSMYMELKLKAIRKANTYTDWMGLQKSLDREIAKCDLRSKGTLNSK